VPAAKQSALDLPHAPSGSWKFGGLLGGRLDAAVDEWLLVAPWANPSMVQMLFDRDRRPRRSLVPWAGEFVGKHLTAAGLTMRVAYHAALLDHTVTLIESLERAQDEDGYLGPHPRSERLVGKTADGHMLWDVWGHYHCIVGLLLWRELRPQAEAIARKIGDLICRTFLDTNTPLSVAGAEEMNMAIAHGMCLLYRATGERRFLEMALRAVKDWEIPPAGDYLRCALTGKEFYECPKPRWESLHCLLALPELYYITGEEAYRQVFEHYWWSILKGDRHNTGGFSSGEQATGNPYDPGAIETCCTVAWIVMSVEMLKLTGDPRVADEIELSTFNASLGGQHPSGRWWTYNTPMDGVKRASAHDIVFQAHPGGPELNCCSVNAPRGPAMLAEWALMRAPDGAALNYYGPSTLETDLPSGNRLRLRQSGGYPKSGNVSVTVEPEHPEAFTLRLRIPQWSAQTRVTVNGEAVGPCVPGSYLAISREWRHGDRIRVRLDMSFHYWVGEREQAGNCSIYRGPLLLAYDQQYNSMDPDAIPPLDAGVLASLGSRLPAPGSRLGTRADRVAVERPFPSGRELGAGSREPGVSWRWVRDVPWLNITVPSADGRELVLCDFASAGAAGTQYRSWLPITGLSPRPFCREKPVWCVRPGEE
jgi:DUF1680 family protein